MNEMAKIFILFGLILFFIGIFILFSPKIPFLGRLPGDIYIKKDGVSFYFPVASSIIISLILSIILGIFFRK